MASRSDYQVASLAAGFSLGFGFLTVWEAMKQTRRNKNPLRSTYIYMVWGEILVNLAIAIIAWLFLDGVIGSTVPVLFFILFLWVFEVQLLMQIIINRIAIIHESPRRISWLKWGTVGVISVINIAVFCIWIPAHMSPPVSQTFVRINEYWDRMSKVLILIVDAGLNWYFLRVVKKRLLEHYGLVKYKPLINFNAKLMVVSILMDAMLIGLMSLPNQVVYIQFHPVAYMVKLNIEMSMASLITRLARGDNNDVRMNSLSDTDRLRYYGNDETTTNRNAGLKSMTKSRARHTMTKESGGSTATQGSGIQKTTDVDVTVHHASSEEGMHRTRKTFFDDEVSLTNNAGHPSEQGKVMDERSSYGSTQG